MKRTLLFVLALVAVGCAEESMTAEVQSTSARVTTLEQRLENAERGLATAERRLATLESASATQPQTRSQPEATSEKWKDLSLWNQLRPAMIEARVKSILGEPTEVSLGSGEMVFIYHDDDGRNDPCRGLVYFQTYTSPNNVRATIRPRDCD
jgi:hypothetical protein